MVKLAAVLDKKLDIKTNKELYIVQWTDQTKGFLTRQAITSLDQGSLTVIDQFENKYGHLLTTHIGKVRVPSHVKNQIAKEEVPRTKPINKKSHAKIKVQSHLYKKLQTQNSSSIHSDEKQRKNKQKQNLEELNNTSQSPINKQRMFQIDIAHNKIQNNNKCVRGQQQQNQQKKVLYSAQKYQDHHQMEERENMDSEILSDSPKQNLYNKKGQGEQKQQKQQSTINGYHDMNVEIIGMKRRKGNFEFFIKEFGKKKWCSHNYMLNLYPRKLCAFYERNIEFN